MSDHLEPDEAFASEEEMKRAYDPSVGDGTPNTAPERAPVDDSEDPWLLNDPWHDDEDDDPDAF